MRTHTHTHTYTRPLNTQEACALDAVLTVVDARHVTQHLDEIKPDGVVNEAGEHVPSSEPVWYRVCWFVLCMVKVAD